LAPGRLSYAMGADRSGANQRKAPRFGAADSDWGRNGNLGLAEGLKTCKDHLYERPVTELGIGGEARPGRSAGMQCDPRSVVTARRPALRNRRSVLVGDRSRLDHHHPSLIFEWNWRWASRIETAIGIPVALAGRCGHRRSPACFRDHRTVHSAFPPTYAPPAHRRLAGNSDPGHDPVDSPIPGADLAVWRPPIEPPMSRRNCPESKYSSSRLADWFSSARSDGSAFLPATRDLVLCPTTAFGAKSTSRGRNTPREKSVKCF
jgi:hypothetical protein